MDATEQARYYEMMRRVAGALQNAKHCGNLQDLRLGKKMRDGRITHHVQWRHDKPHRFVVDMEANAVVLPAILPATLQPQLPREVHAFLRNEGCLDSELGELRMFVKHGALTLSMTFRDARYEDCTNYLVRLAERVLAEFSERSPYESFRAPSIAAPSVAVEFN